MRSFKDIKESYDFTEEDAERLASLRPLMEGHSEAVMESLYDWIMSSKATARFFTEELRQRHVFGAQKQWFLDLFSGNYDSRYYERLIKIGIVHVKSGVDAHFMNRAVSLVRNQCIDILCKSGELDEQTQTIISFEKLLDINLDVITSSYIEEEIRTYSPMYKVKSALVDFAERFTQVANLALVLALMGLTIGVLGLFYLDVKTLLAGDLAGGIISALGSLLILWVMIELMNTEISHLRGGKFRISVFIGVALVTIIRETMIATLKHERSEALQYLIASILVIGLVYWLVTKSEDKGK